MRTLIIPDLHTRWQWAERVIAKHSPSRVVFLGDYFDTWADQDNKGKDGPTRNGEVARWLRASLGDARRTHLWGNHDLHYYAPKFRCSGFTHDKHRAIRHHMMLTDWAKLDWFTWADGWLLSHAGLHPAWIPDWVADHDELTVWLLGEVAEVNRAVAAKRETWITAYGPARTAHGHSSYVRGGLIWLDYHDEFEPVPGLNQVFGHTPGAEARLTEAPSSINWCIDAPGTVAIIEDCKLRIEEEEEDDSPRGTPSPTAVETVSNWRAGVQAWWVAP